MENLKKDLVEVLKMMFSHMHYMGLSPYSVFIDLNRIKGNECANVIHIYLNKDYQSGCYLNFYKVLESDINNILSNVCDINFYVGHVDGEVEIQIGLYEKM